MAANEFWWRIYYSDKERISSYEWTPYELVRRSDVQVIVQESPDHNWITTCKSDYYIWVNLGDGFRWWGVDIFGLHDYLLKPGPKCVLFGSTISNDRFREIFDQARAEFGEKGSFTPEERRP